MASDLDAVMKRLAAQPAAVKVIRNRLVSEGYSIREATARATRITEAGRAGQITEGPPLARSKAITEAVAVALAQQKAARKAHEAAERKARDRAVVEAAVTGALRDRLLQAAQFSEDAIGKSLREASSDDLAAITATALAGPGQPRPAPGPAVEVTADPRVMSLEELGVAATAAAVTASSAGNSPFWSGQTAGDSPFWRGMQGGGSANA